MSFESSPYFPLRISLSSNTGVSIVTPPCNSNTSVIVRKILCLSSMSVGCQSFVPCEREGEGALALGKAEIKGGRGDSPLAF